MKKVILLIALLLALSVPVFAAGQLLVDDANILTSAEERRLEKKLEEASETCNMDIAIVTVDGIDSYSIGRYTEDYYDDNGYADDGVMLLIDMDERQWWITGTGKGADIFTSSVIDTIGDLMEDDLTNGDYAAAFETYIDKCIYYVESPFEAGTSLLIGLVIGLIVALIVTGIWRAQLKSVRHQAAAANYLKPGSLLITGSQDLYLYSTVTKVKRQQSSSGSSSGRSHSGGGGRF